MKGMRRLRRKHINARKGKGRSMMAAAMGIYKSMLTREASGREGREPEMVTRTRDAKRLK